MPEQIVPESRIFRIGRECYIIYLGKERDDIRPFLRIGNSRDIPDEVLDAVSTTVISDDHVGNPLLEILFVPKVKGRYLGDTEVVGTIRRFFKSFDLPTDEVTDYRKVKDGERRHMVWFYSSGNIHLRYDDQVIFDLDKREREDRHFVRLYEEAKGEFLRNPLRYIRQDFNGPGLILSNANAYWFEGGDLLSFQSNPGFVADLMSEGIDPDFISSMAYNLTRNELDTHDAAVFVGYIKRTRQRRKQLRVITSETEIQRNLKLLFPERGSLPAALDVADVSGKRKATFKDSIVSFLNGKWVLHRSGLPEIGFDNNGESPIQVNPDSGTIRVSQENSVFTFQPPRGFPINLVGHDLPLRSSVDKYLGYTLSYIKDHLSAGEESAVALVDRYLRLLFDDINSEKASLSPLHKQTASNVRDGLKRLSLQGGGPSWFFYANALTLVELAIEELVANHPIAKSVEQISRSLRDLLDRSPSPEHILPFWGDLYLGKTPCLLWKAAKRGFVAADLATTREANEKIQTITRLNEVPWHEDRERLVALIRSLDSGGQGPLTSEQLALLTVVETKTEQNRSEEKKKPIEKKTDRNETDEGHGFAGGRKTTEKIPEKTDKSEKKTTKESRKGVLWLLILLLLVLLVAGAWFWDRSGTAPWGAVTKDWFGLRETESGRAAPDSSGEITGDGAIAGGSSDATDSSVAAEDSSAAVSGGDTAAGDDGIVSEAGDAGEGSGSDGESPTETVESGDSLESAAVGQTDDIDVDVAPRTLEEVGAYLSVDGRINITEVDIHLAANEIAVMNGFKDLNYRVFTGDDPDWIYPGNNLNLPGRSSYTIQRGDTIWFLAAREVRVDVERNLARYDEAVALLDDQDGTAGEQQSAVKILKSIASDSRAAAMRLMASDVLLKRGL